MASPSLRMRMQMSPRKRGRYLVLEPPPRGICRYCHCTEDRACWIDTEQQYGPCSWLNRNQTVCTNPVCLKKHERYLNRVLRSMRKALKSAQREKAALAAVQGGN